MLLLFTAIDNMPGCCQVAILSVDLSLALVETQKSISKLHPRPRVKISSHVGWRLSFTSDIS